MWVMFLSALPPPQQPASRTVYRDSLRNPGWGQIVPSLKKGVAVVQQGSPQRSFPPCCYQSNLPLTELCQTS